MILVNDVPQFTKIDKGNFAVHKYTQKEMRKRRIKALDKVNRKAAACLIYSLVNYAGFFLARQVENEFCKNVCLALVVVGLTAAFAFLRTRTKVLEKVDKTTDYLKVRVLKINPEKSMEFVAFSAKDCETEYVSEVFLPVNTPDVVNNGVIEIPVQGMRPMV